VDELIKLNIIFGHVDFKIRYFVYGDDIKSICKKTTYNRNNEIVKIEESEGIVLKNGAEMMPLFK
jgi:hypothetical protein